MLPITRINRLQRGHAPASDLGVTGERPTAQGMSSKQHAPAGGTAHHWHCPTRTPVTGPAWPWRCPATPSRQPDQPEERDLIERFVGWAFGEKALSDNQPMGMKRIDFSQLPDQVVTPVEQRAAAVPGDDTDVAEFRALLSGTRLEASRLRCAYCAERDGWGAADFHRCVDGFGAGVVVGVTEGGAVLGGYNPEGWIGLGEDRMSNGAFLFCWRDGDTTRTPAKLAKVGGPNLAVIDKADSGPQFGAEGLTIPLKAIRGQERMAKSRLGTYYAKLADGGRSLFGAGDDPKRATLASLRVYVAEGNGEEWKLDGIVWHTSDATTQQG